MKKYLFFFFAIQLSIDGISQTPGQLKITIESFKCRNQSWDGLVEFDGHGNEVFIDYGYRIYNPATPNSFKSGAGFTPVFGSGINGQIKAGTANSTLGGIANGNEIPVNILVLNEHINADNLILFSPSVWEWDNSNNDILNLFNQQLATDLNWMMNQPYPFLNSSFNRIDPFLQRSVKAGDFYFGYRPITKYMAFLGPLVNVQNNRPIGISYRPLHDAQGDAAHYDPSVLILDTKVLAYFYNYNKYLSEINHHEKGSYLTGIVEMVFTENTYGVVTNNGSYTLKLKIEFTPDAASTSPLTGTPTRITTTIKKDMPVKGTITPLPYSMTNEMMYGQWKGTLSMSDETNPAALSFRINNGVFWMLDNNGSSIASGVFKIENNNFSSIYSYPNGDSFSITSTTYNASTGELSGTLFGNGINAAKKGSWKVMKQGN